MTKPVPTRERPLSGPIAWGIVFAGLYLLVASRSLGTGALARSPLYDGLVNLPPYRWVRPPSERTKDNEVPSPERFKVKVDDLAAADPGSITTSDGQATITFDLLTPEPGETSFSATITPLDPMTLGPPPAKHYFDGNAYRFEATYDKAHRPVTGKFSVILRYSVHARQVQNWNGSGWVELAQPLVTQADLQLSSMTPEMGTFVVTGTGTRPKEIVSSGSLGLTIGIFLLAGSLVAIGVLFLFPWLVSRRKAH